MVPRSNGYKKWWQKIKGRLEHNRDEKVVVVEIGCGKRIPTVRQNSERIIRSCPMGQARLVRINPGQRKQTSHKGQTTPQHKLRSVVIFVATAQALQPQHSSRLQSY